MPLVGLRPAILAPLARACALRENAASPERLRNPVTAVIEANHGFRIKQRLGPADRPDRYDFFGCGGSQQSRLGGYALSKAALDVLAKLYAHEFTQTHITPLAPGIIDRAMMDHLCEEEDRLIPDIL